eukprot:gene31365-38742_t
MDIGKSFYGQNGSALIDGALPLNVEEININIEKYLSSTNSKQGPTARIVRVLSFIRSCCGRLPGRDSMNVRQTVLSLVTVFDRIIELDDAVLAKAATDDILNSFLMNVFCYATGPDKMMLSIVNFINTVKIVVTDDTSFSMAVEVFKLLKEISLLHKVAYSLMDSFAESLFAQLGHTKLLDDDERDSIISTAIDTFNALYFKASRLFNFTGSNKGLRRVALSMFRLWHVYNCRLDFYAEYAKFLTQCREAKLRGKPIVDFLNTVLYICKKIDKRLRDGIVDSLLTISAAGTSEEKCIGMKQLSQLFRSIPSVPKDVIIAIRANIAEFKLSRNVSFVALQLSDECRDTPAELLFSLSYLVTQLGSSDRNNRLWARNLCEVFDVRLSLALMLSLSIDGVANPKSDHEKVDHMVVFLGLTGAGKSTTINYLTDTEYIAVEDSGFNLTLEEAPNQARTPTSVGYSSTSKTLYPQVVYGRNGLNLADCPGFQDNRRSNLASCSKIAVPLAVYCTHKVTAAVITVEWASCNPTAGARGESLKDLSRILAIIFRDHHTLDQHLKHFPVSPLTIVVTKAPEKPPERLRRAFLANVNEILEGQENRYLEIPTINDSIQVLEADIQHRQQSGQTLVELQVLFARKANLTLQLEELCGEKRMMEMIASGDHEIFFISPGMSDNKQELLDYIARLQAEDIHIPHACFNFNPQSPEFANIFRLIHDGVEANQELLKSLVKFHSESSLLESKLAGQEGVIRQRDALLQSILSGNTVGKKNEVLEQQLLNTIMDYEQIVETLSLSVPAVRGWADREQIQANVINNLPPIEYGSKARVAKVYTISEMVGFNNINQKWMFPYKYRFKQPPNEEVIPIHRVEMSCVVDEEGESQTGGEMDLRVLFASGDIPPDMEDKMKVGTDETISVNFHGKHSDIYEVLPVPLASQATGSFKIVQSDLASGLLEIEYRMQTGGRYKSCGVRTYVFPKHLPENRHKLFTIEDEIKTCHGIIAKNLAEKIERQEVIEHNKKRLARHQSGKGDNQKDKLELLRECVEKAERRISAIVTEFFTSLTEADLKLLRNPATLMQMETLLSSEASSEIWAAISITRSELRYYLHGDQDMDGVDGSAPILPTNNVQLLNSYQQNMVTSILHSIGPSLKRIVVCCDATGLLIPSLHEVLNWSEFKQHGVVSDLDLRRAIQREKHISNFLYEHLAKQYTEKKRFLSNIAVLVDLLKFGDTTVREDANTVFVNDLKLIESQQLEWRTFRPLQLADLNAVIADIKNIDRITRDALEAKLQLHHLNIRSLSDVDNMPGWSQLYFSSRIQSAAYFADKGQKLRSTIS